MKEWIKKNKVDLIVYFGFILIVILLIMLAVIPNYSNAINTNSRYNPTAIKITEKIQIQWYAIFILSGLIMGATAAVIESKRFGWVSDNILDGVLIIAPLAIIGARLYYVIFQSSGTITSIRDVFSIWEGGLAIHGAIITASISIIFYCRYKKISTFALADVLAIGLLMGQIAGRWGNFMNAEAHGDVSTSPFLMKLLPNFIEHQMHFSAYSGQVVSGIYLPTFFFESLWNFIGLTLLFILRRTKTVKAGDLIGIYLIWYGLGRGILIEPFRTDQLKPIFGVPVNILLSLVLFVGGGIIYLILKRVFNKNTPYYVDTLIYEADLNFRKEK